MNTKSSLPWWLGTLSLTAAVLLAGCQSNKTSPASEPMAKATTPPPVAVESKPALTSETKPVEVAESKPAPMAETKPAQATEPTAMNLPVRINAGATASVTNANGDVWLADTGFEGGGGVERESNLQITNTDTPEIYRSEHHSMNSFSYKLPDGKYTVKLHFAETFHGVTAAGGRVFSMNVEGKEFKDFDVFAKAGGANRAYVETVDVDVTDGKLDITFKAGVQNPEINGIEIIPKS